MLFTALLKVKAGTVVERTTRRLEWQYPDGVKVVAEYWLQTPDPNCITIFEVESIAPMMAATAPWSDVFDITIVPTVRAEEGIEIAKQMIQP